MNALSSGTPENADTSSHDSPKPLSAPDLRGITLACIDTANHALALRALALSSRSLAFGRTLVLTDAIPRGIDVPMPIEVRAIVQPGAEDGDAHHFTVSVPFMPARKWPGNVQM